MKSMLMMMGLLLLQAYTHPFAEQGSVDNDPQILEERMEKAEENRRQEQQAEEAIEEQKQNQEEIDRNLQPEYLLQDKKEGSIE